MAAKVLGGREQVKVAVVQASSEFMDKNGSVLGRHRKLIPSIIERIWWGQGDSRDSKVFDTDIGRLGGQIC